MKRFTRLNRTFTLISQEQIHLPRNIVINSRAEPNSRKPVVLSLYNNNNNNNNNNNK